MIVGQRSLTHIGTTPLSHALSDAHSLNTTSPRLVMTASKSAFSRLSTSLGWIWRRRSKWGPATTLEGWIIKHILTWLAKHLSQAVGAVQPLSYLKGYVWYDSSHDKNDASYQWLMAYWENHPKILESNNFITKTGVPDGAVVQNLQYQKPQLEQDRQAKLTVLPAFVPQGGTTLHVWYQGTLIRLDQRRQRVDFARGKTYASGVLIDAIRLRVYSRNRGILLRFLHDAKKLFERERPPRIIVKSFTGGRTDSWSSGVVKQKRAWENVILPLELKQLLEREVEDFLKSESFYGARGLVHKRGIMLYGPPGSGKSSTILALASKFNFDIYTLPLTSDVTDSEVAEAMRQVPGRAMVVLEDIDVWHSTRRDLQEDESQPRAPGTKAAVKTSVAKKGTISLSTLLNLLDGVESSDGKLFIMTTNNLQGLDPAILRAGRCDVKVEFCKATCQQASELFVIFYRPYEQPIVGGITEATLQDLARQWAAHVRDAEFNLASLQGMLLLHKADSAAAVESMPDWVADQREERQKLLTATV